MHLRAAIPRFLSSYFTTHSRSGRTRAAYAGDLEQFLRFRGGQVEIAAALSPEGIEAWVRELAASGYKPASVRRKVATLRVFCDFWVRGEEIEQSPFWRLKLSYGRIEQLPRTLSEGEVQSLLRQARRLSRGHGRCRRRPLPSDRALRGLRNFALVDLLFATGMRVGEVSGLDLDDYSPEERTLVVHGKGGRDRLAFLVDPETIRIQETYREARLGVLTDSTALFLNHTGSRLSTQGIANVLRKLRDEAGLARHITPHMFRHTVATLLLRNGVDIRVVQEFLGHASITTTQRYTHVTKEHLIQALRLAHPSLGLR